MTNKHRCKKLTKLLGAVEDGWVSWGAPVKLGKKLPNSTINWRGIWGIFGEHNSAKPVATRHQKFHEKLTQRREQHQKYQFWVQK